MKIREARGRKAKTFASKYGHSVVFVPYVDPATCKPSLAAALKGDPMPDACPRRGPGSGVSDAGGEVLGRDHVVVVHDAVHLHEGAVVALADPFNISQHAVQVADLVRARLDGQPRRYSSVLREDACVDGVCVCIRKKRDKHAGLKGEITSMYRNAAKT